MATKFYIDSRTDKKGDAAIRVSIAIKGMRFVTSTGLKLAPAKWDDNNHRAKKGVSNSAGMTWAQINSRLSEILTHFDKYENDCIIKNSIPDVNALKAEFASVFGKKTKETKTETIELYEPGFWDYYNMFISERSVTNEWTAATKQKFHALKSHLQGWRKNLSFDDFDEAGLSSFLSFLTKEQKLKNTTVGKVFGFTKWFLRWATLKGYNTNVAYQTFTPKLKTAPKNVVFLEWDELMRVLDYEIPRNGTAVTLQDANGEEYTKVVHDSAAIATSRDIFCFCCFTSLRYSDAANLKRANIHDNIMTITTVKTSDTLTIELNKYARSILERYKDRKELDGYVFPHMTNQRMNIYLKDLCELCGINQPVAHTYFIGAQRFEEVTPKFELIGTHTGRRTFICNALMLGIPAEIVMKWTGHSDYKSMKPYIDVTNQAKAAAMGLFDKL